MSRTIVSSRLTTCGITEKGRAIRLGFLDQTGQPISIEFPFEQAESVTMTLPQMLAQALKLRTADDASRYVFPLTGWTIESTDQNVLVVTLTTDDGFTVSFGIPFGTCERLGSALCNESLSAGEESCDAQQAASTLLN